MSDTTPVLIANVTSSVQTGDNTSSISIAISGDNPGPYVLSLTIPFSFVAFGDVGKITFSPADLNPQTVAPQPSDGTTFWLAVPRGITVPAEAPLALPFVITLSGIFTAATSDQTITLGWWPQGQPAPGAKPSGSLPLTIPVQQGQKPPFITEFTAKPQLVTVTDKFNPPPVTLTWESDASSTVKLTRFGQLLTSTTARQYGQYVDTSYYPPAGVQAYQLTATFNGVQVSQWLFVCVQDSEWHQISFGPGSPALLLNDFDNALYGVLVENSKARIYQLYPDTGPSGQLSTLLYPSSADIDDPDLDTMARSPGAFFNNKIWLVGGSQIDPQVCSNSVWWFDPDPTVTSPSGTTTAPWTARALHACVVFNSQLWILGGVDGGGNTLNDAWFSPDGVNWTQSPTNLPMPLCMLTAIAFEELLWIYGGTSVAPWGNPQADLWRFPVLDSQGEPQWASVNFRSPDFGPPFGSALFVNPETNILSSLATFRGSSKRLWFTGFVGDQADLNHEDLFSGDPSKLWPTIGGAGLLQPFRLSAVPYREKVFVVSLIYNVPDPTTLNYYVFATS